MRILCFFFSFLFCLFLSPGLNASTPPTTLLLTIPKSGTHLLYKAAALIAKKQRAEEANIFICHLFPGYLPNFNEVKESSGQDYIKIVLLRDPRDILISQVFWLKKYDWAPTTSENFRHEFNRLSFDDQLSFAIQFPKDYFGVCEYVKMALEWIKNPSVLVCRFEDLVGPQGGGDRTRQEKTIRELALHMGYDLSNDEIVCIADKLFGNTNTFRSGQIGAWKNHFSPYHKELFKQVMGKELIDLGYASDENW